MNEAMQKRTSQKTIIYFISVISIITYSFATLNHQDEKNLDKSRILNEFIKYINIETQKTILFPDYLYRYNEEVQRYKTNKKANWGGPYYFSPHKSFSPSEEDYKQILKRCTNFPVYKKLLQSKLKQIHKIITYKYQLIQELHQYSINKEYEKDHFSSYNKIYPRMVQSINYYFYKAVNLYMDINRMNSELNPQKADSKKEVNNILIFITKLNVDFNTNAKLMENLLLKYNTGLPTEKIPFKNIQLKDTNYIQYRLLAGISQESLIQNYKDYIVSSVNFRKNYENIIKDSLSQYRIKKITRATLFYNDVVEKYNLLRTMMENTFPLEIQKNFLRKFKLPIMYLPGLKQAIQKQIFDEVPPNRIVLLLDFSSSMNLNNKLEILKSSIPELFTALRPQDKIGIVVFSGRAREILPLSKKSYYPLLEKTLNNIKIQNTTKIGDGLKIAYKILKEEESGMNKRIIIITDGVFNTDSKLLKLIQKKAIGGIKLSTFYYRNSKSEINSTLRELSIKGLGNNYKITNKNIKLFFLRELNGM